MLSVQVITSPGVSDEDVHEWLAKHFQSRNMSWNDGEIRLQSTTAKAVVVAKTVLGVVPEPENKYLNILGDVSDVDEKGTSNE